MMVALGTALLLVGSAFAQAPGTAPAAPTTLPLPDAPAAVPTTCASGCGSEGGHGPQFWATGEFIYGWIRGDGLPPLVTASPAGTARASAGALGFPTTTVLFGGNTVNEEGRPGLRLAAGYWFDDARTLGLEAGGMFLASRATGFAANSDGSTILARPFLDVTTGLPSSVLVAFPGNSAGAIEVNDRSGKFYEAHIDFAENVVDDGWIRIDALLGYRFYRFEDSLRINQAILPNAAVFVPGTQFLGTDQFSATNEFHGGDFGIRTQLNWGDLSLTLLSKLAVGNVARDVVIGGGTVTNVPGLAPVFQVGNVLALPSNIGVFHGSDWTILPELGATVSWQVVPSVRVIAGYTALWLNRIARAADQADLTLNPALFLPGAIPAPTDRPALLLPRWDSWLQTVSVGVEFTY
jgi:hypothetical protein